jgi:hypothetical protein
MKNVHKRERELDREGEMSFKCTKPRQTIGQTQRVSLREKKREGEGEGEGEGELRDACSTVLKPIKNLMLVVFLYSFKLK